MKLKYLISDNDWDNIRNALLDMRDITLSRTMGDTTVIASTEHDPSYTRRVAMVVCVKAVRRGLVVRQIYESAEAAQKELATWSLFDE